VPEQRTEVRACWTRDALHLQFAVWDTDPWATLLERKALLYTEEVVEVFLDPAGDGEGYFELELNPLNTVLDLALRRNRSGFLKDFGWVCEGLSTGVRRTPWGWVGSWKIPFLAVAAEPPAAGAVWRVNFCRIDRPKGRPRELSAWVPTLSGTFHSPRHFGALEFSGPRSAAASLMARPVVS